MRTALLLLVGTFTFTINNSQAQEPVLIAGGSTPPTPIVVGDPAVNVPAASVGYVPVMMPVMAPVVYAPPVQIVSGGYCNPPNVIYFGGPNSCYNYCRVGCNYSPSVIYFGRGEACQRGYAFRHPR